MQSEYLYAVKNGGTVVTANARLARDLRRGYDEHCRSACSGLWQAPDILAWGDWIERCFTGSVETGAEAAPILLSPAQERFLWERIIERSGESQGLLDIPATAAAAADAYALAASWEVPLRAADCYGFEDAAAFVGWAADFDRTLEASNWRSRAHLAGDVARLTARGCFFPPARLLHAGFDELSPAQRRLLDALAGAGCQVEAVEPPTPVEALRSRIALPDTAREIAAAARWARARVSQEPNARVGVVVPELTAVQAMVERVFEDVLHPSYEPVPASRGRAFHISSGTPLAGIPIIAAALQALGLGRETIPLPDAGTLMRSPFLAGAEAERGPRALLDVELRRRGLAEMTVGTLASLAGSRQPDGCPRPFSCPVLALRLRAWRRFSVRLPERQLPGAWSRTFSRLLRLTGWPGDRTPGSPEYQAIERWNELLCEFAALDLVAEPMNYAAALARLRRMAGESRFAPADEGAPIQVMGMLEAAGARFDHLWVTGLEDRRWPAPPSPNPFLPLPLQRARGLPHFSAERELA